MIGEDNKVEVEELIVLSKFEGDALPENEFERIHIVDNKIVGRFKVENGEITDELSIDDL